LEILFNLLWVALSAALVGLWVVGRAGEIEDSPRSSTRMQITALAVLLVILFPVVSLTDDLLAYTAPAEVEHLVRRDLQDQPAAQIDAAAAIIGALFWFPDTPGSGIPFHTSRAVRIGTPREESLEVLGNRPPPSA
jgi:hypothetical protein